MIPDRYILTSMTRRIHPLGLKGKTYQMTDTFEIITVENTKKLPNGDLRWYSLDKNETKETAADKFKAIYGREPEKGYLWSSYVYFPLQTE